MTEQDITTLTPVYTNPRVLEGLAIVAHNPSTGDPIAFDAGKLCNTAFKDLSMYTIYGGSLAKRETANCYVIKEAGAYMFPLVYGNAIKGGVANPNAYTNNGATYSNDFVNSRDVQITSPFIELNTGCAVASCEVVWQDHQDLIQNLELYEGGDCKYVRFIIDSMPSLNANAIIAVKDGSGNILWSWHIWCCLDDLSPITFTNHTEVNYDLMPINLGWKWDSTDRLRGRSPHYQWGRKDPMPCPAAYNSTSNTSLWGAKTYGSAEADTIGAAIKNPHLFYKQDGETYYNWFTGGSKYNLWNAAVTTTGAGDDQASAKKTIYDPCPVGFMLPAGRAFTGFTTSGGNVSSGAPTGCEVIGEWSNGWTMKKNANDTVGNFFAASGYRNRTSGALGYVGSNGYYWSFASDSQANAYYLNFLSSYLYPLYGSYRANGFAVRPCRELS